MTDTPDLDVLTEADRKTVMITLSSLDAPSRVPALDLFMRLARRIGELEGRLAATEATSLSLRDLVEKLAVGGKDVRERAMKAWLNWTEEDVKQELVPWPKPQTIHLLSHEIGAAVCGANTNSVPTLHTSKDLKAVTCVECKRMAAEYLNARGRTAENQDVTSRSPPTIHLLKGYGHTHCGTTERTPCLTKDPTAATCVECKRLAEAK